MTGVQIAGFSLIHNSIAMCNLYRMNGGRAVEGLLCGFDPFMNLVLDNSIEFTKQVAYLYYSLNKA